MKLYFELLKLLFGKIFLRRSNGTLIRNFAEHMGIVYIKLAQMLATQNFGQLFTEADRLALSGICDDCNPIDFTEIMTILQREYGDQLTKIFAKIDETPVGSASVSQVHHATLVTGEEVAIKIKRQDVADTVERDIATIRKLVHRFGKFVRFFHNYTGGDHALELYLEWVRQETDFRHEQANIATYQAFADNVNGQIKGTKQIKLPKLYQAYCTDHIIVMEFVHHPTINKLPLTAANKAKVATAFNDYIRLSFWAMFHGQPIAFHGDPHSGNISIDDAGNIWFLDLGLLCTLDDFDAKLCLEFYLAAYAGNHQKLYDMIVSYGDLNEKQKRAFKTECQKYCAEVHHKEVTYYFVDMMNICLHYEIVPPNFLFNMAKAFVCLNGISNFTDNSISAHELLAAQTMEYLLRRSLQDCQTFLSDGLQLIPQTFTRTVEQGLASALSHLATNQSLKQDAATSLEHLKEVIDLASATYLNRHAP